jgi:putative ABC transport system permease protein
VTLGFFYGRLAWQSIRRNPGLAALMVGGLALGIATWVTARAAIQGALRNPLPDKQALYHVSLERPPLFADVPPDGTISENRMENGPKFTLSEAEMRAILAARRGRGRITPTLAGRAAVRPPSRPLLVGHVRFATRDLFGLFDLDFAEGGPWTPADDSAGNPVVVLDGETARIWFGSGGAVGRTVEIAGTPFRVVGVLAGGPREKLYDHVYFGHQTERFFAPFEAHRRYRIDSEYGAEIATSGTGRANELAGFLWAELPTEAERTALVADATAAGLPLRLLPFAGFRAEFYHLHPAYYLLDLFAKVTLIASALNLVRLLLAKFSARADLSGIHRALGASRRSIVLVHVIEAKLIGIGAGIVGLGLAAIAVPILNALVPDRIADAALDGTAIVVTVLVAVLVGIVAGIYPAWRATQQAPAVFLRGA